MTTAAAMVATETVITTNTRNTDEHKKHLQNKGHRVAKERGRKGLEIKRHCMKETGTTKKGSRGHGKVTASVKEEEGANQWVRQSYLLCL